MARTKYNLKKEFLTIPNLFTLIRVFAVPFIMWLIIGYKGTSPTIYIAFAILVFAALTDLFDGRIARRFNQVSNLGKVLDPFADKMLHIGTLLALTINGNVHIAFVIILAVKEFYMILGGAILFRGADIVVQANMMGKAASVVICGGIILAFFNNVETTGILRIISYVVFGIGLVMTYIAAANYTKEYLTQAKKSRAKLLAEEKEEKSEEEITE